MENYSLSEVIEQAVQTEKLGYEFYTGTAAKFKDEHVLKELFGLLASKERGHERKFSELKRIVRDEEAVDWDEVSKYLRAIVESEFFLGSDKSLLSLGDVTTVDEAVKLAIGFEKETLLYFYAIKDIIREKDILEEIIEEEKSHITWLGRFREGLKK
jgi:rubrerythrin